MYRMIFALIISLMLALTPAQAEGPAPFPDFTFKRVKPPKPDSTGSKRITVQIDPEEQKNTLPVKAAEPRPNPETAQRQEAYEWFWQTVSPSIEDAGPGRLNPALTSLGNPPDGQHVKTPRLQDLQDIARERGADILLSTVGTKVSPALVLAVIAIESGGRSDAVSSAGAGGLMQLMPATAERFGVSDTMSAGENIKGGVAFLDFLMAEFDGDPILVLAGYNAGENAVRKHGGVPPYAETRDYVPKVLAAFRTARGLCRTPPELVSDGCVFAIMNKS